MSSSAYDDDPPPRPRKSAGPPTWLIVTLSVVLLVGIVCIGGLAGLVYWANSANKSWKKDATQSDLFALHSNVTTWQAQNGSYPDSLKAMNTPGANMVYADSRDPKQASLVYLVPPSNSASADILAHTSRTGPLPIMAIHLDGRTEEFAAVSDLDFALVTQQNRPPPDPDSEPPKPVKPPSPSGFNPGGKLPAGSGAVPPMPTPRPPPSPAEDDDGE